MRNAAPMESGTHLLDAGTEESVPVCMPAPGPEMEEKEAKEMERGRELIRSMGKSVKAMDVRMQLTARGIEFVQTNSLN